MCPKDSVLRSLGTLHYIQEILWDMLQSCWDLVRLQSVPLWDGGVTQEILSKAPRTLHSMRMRHCGQQTSWLLNWRCRMFSAGQRLVPAQGQELGAIWLLQTESLTLTVSDWEISAVRFAWQSNTSLVSSTGACSVLLMFRQSNWLGDFKYHVRAWHLLTTWLQTR